MSNILYGKPVAESLYLELARELKVYNLTPHLVNVGLQNNQQWLQYTTSICKVATEHDITVDNIFLPEDVSEQEFYDKVSKLSDDRTVDAIMVQQPLPARYNNSRILSAINVNKDVDCLCDVSLARLYRGESVFTPATPTAVICLLDYYNIDVFGKNVTVIGRGNAVGKPLSLMLTARNATVTLCHSKTENLLTHTANADIIICATGKNNLLNADMISSSAIVLDVGLNFVNGHTCGDVDFQSVSIVAKAISPVPGGIGVVTTATLLRNTLTACKLNTAKLVK